MRVVRAPAKQLPGDKPLSDSAQQYVDQLWKETDATLRLDEAKHGEVRRWDWKSLGQLQKRGARHQS